MPPDCYLDTNIILRIILNDKPALTQKIIDFLQNKHKFNLILSDLVIFETFQVLTGKRLAYTFQEAAEFLSQLILTLDQYLKIENQAQHLAVCALLSTKKVDYVDAFIFIQATKAQAQILSFDKDGYIDKLNPKIRIRLENQKKARK